MWDLKHVITAIIIIINCNKNNSITITVICKNLINLEKKR